jgi:hypothetical protein
MEARMFRMGWGLDTKECSISPRFAKVKRANLLCFGRKNGGVNIPITFK